MSNKLKHSTLSQGWGVTSVCKNVTTEKGIATFLTVSERIGQLSSLVLVLLLTMIVSTPSIGQCTLTCDDQKQISIGTNGYAVIIPALVLNGDHSCAGDIVVTLFDENNQSIGDTVTCEHVNKTFQVSVSSATLNVDCWSTIVVEDKLAPRIFCRDTTLVCSADTSPEILGYPGITDNCEEIDSTALRYFDLYNELPCGTLHNGLEIGGRITRSWTALDNFGNVGTCTQSIYLLKENVNNIVFPQHRDDVNGPPVSCTQGAIDDPAQTGEPMINGQPVRNGDACKLFINFQDQRVDVCPPASYRVIRRWEITDVCTQEVRVGIQNLLVVDRDPPVITCPDSFAVTSNVTTCGATVFLRQATATDSCSSFTIQPSWEFGTGYGPFSDVPVGVHEVTYTATDQCGNFSTCTAKVAVIDNIQPVAICKDELHVALNNQGIATINASVFDGGSRDNCTITRWEANRDTLFQENLSFTCEDVGDTIRVRLRVYDAAGLSSECSMDVLVTDETRPVFTNCPADITLNCAQDYTNTAITGIATAVDICGIQEVYYEDAENITACNIGRVIRTWIAVDSTGNRTTCQQLITIEDNTPLSVVLPPDYETNDCGADISPAVTGEPTVSGADCESILVSHTDEVFLLGDSACMKILRTWTVLDWCTFDPNDSLNSSRVSGVQLIKVTDLAAPDITDCVPDITVEITEDACEARVDVADLVATDCNPNLTITNTSIYADANGANASGTYPIGVHTVRFVVSDGCGNTNNCEMTVTVVDRFEPTPVCKYDISIPLSANGTVTVPPNLILAGSYDNCSTEENLIFEIRPDYFTCADTGRQTINLIVTDENGNSAFCTTEIVIQDNNGTCSSTAPKTAIGGRIFTENGEGMEEVPVQITGGIEQMGYTDAAGSYLFENLSRQSTYTVRPMTNDDYREGLTTFDLLLIRKHILGITPLNSPYKLLAADVNNSGAISAFDMVVMRQVILDVKHEFPNNTSWRYIDASYDFPDPRNPFMEAVPEFRDYKELLINDLERDFIGVKVGDVNNSASPTAMAAGGRSKQNTLRLAVEDIVMKAGNEYRIPVTGKELQAIQGYQFTIDFNSELLQFKEVISGEPISMSQNNFGLNKTTKGKLTTSWENVGDIRTNKETVLFTLVFEAKETVELSEALTINSSVTPAEAYDEKEELLDVNLHFSTNKLDKNVRLFQNRPNPFRDQTMISFNLPVSTEGAISIFDINGKLLKTYYGKYAQGYNQVAIDLSEIHTQTGVLYYQLTTPVTKRLSEKMVLIRE